MRPDLDHVQFEVYTLARMDHFFRETTVTGYERLIDDMKGVHKKDRHVAAAAKQGSCGVILTNNLKHFPASALAPHGIVAQKPDDFLLPILLANPVEFCEVAREHRISLTKPPYDVEAYLEKLARDSLSKTASELRTLHICFIDLAPSYGGRVYGAARQTRVYALIRARKTAFQRF